jgi:hypothetical protein
MDFAQLVLQVISNGGTAAVIAILFAAIVVLVWDRKTLVKELNDTTQKVYDAKDSETKSIKEIVDRYHTGNLNLVQALNEIKVVLTSIQNSKR